MPIYEYQCKKCRHRFERIQKFADPQVRKCPQCGGPVEQLLSPPAVQFKGSGWYVTDYAKKATTSSTSAGDSADSTSRAESGTKAEPAAKKDEKPKSEHKKAERK